jgi:histidinol-phosphate aminotransferase
VPRRVVVVLDEAYTEYLPDAQRYDSIAWLKSHPNLVITRTFSKAYGLAGMRVGFALSHPDVADLMNRIRQPFNVNTVAQAGAIAALHDDDYVARSRRLNDEGLRQLIAGFDRMDLPYIPSFGNFVCVRVGDAAGIFRRLLERGVIVRPVGGYAMPEWLRISVGLPAENERFLEALGAVLAPAVAHR